MFSFASKQNGAADELQQKIDALPKQLKAWRAELVNKGLPAAKAAAADRDRALAALRSEMAPHEQARDKARQELETARAYVANVPLDAPVEDVATQAVIADQWPERVAAYNQMASEVQSRINAVETAYDAALRHAQAEITLEYQQALRALDEVKPSIFRMLE